MVEHTALGRPSGWRRLRRVVTVVLSTTVALVCLLGVVLAVVAGIVLATEAPRREPALALRERGVTGSAVVTGEDGEITLDTGGRQVVTELLAEDADALPLPPALLTVVHLPDDPTVAMLPEDVAYYADKAVPTSEAALVTGLAPITLVTLAWLVCGRPRWHRNLWKPELDLPDLDLSLDL